jgi:hypothetical protein
MTVDLGNLYQSPSWNFHAYPPAVVSLDVQSE